MTTAGAASTAVDVARMYSVDRDASLGLAGPDLGLPAVESDSHATTASWRKALDNVVPACVVLK